MQLLETNLLYYSVNYRWQ